MQLHASWTVWTNCKLMNLSGDGCCCMLDRFRATCSFLKSWRLRWLKVFYKRELRLFPANFYRHLIFEIAKYNIPMIYLWYFKQFIDLSSVWSKLLRFNWVWVNTVVKHCCNNQSNLVWWTSVSGGNHRFLRFWYHHFKLSGIFRFDWLTYSRLHQSIHQMLDQLQFLLFSIFHCNKWFFVAWKRMQKNIEWWQAVMEPLESKPR